MKRVRKVTLCNGISSTAAKEFGKKRRCTLNKREGDCNQWCQIAESINTLAFHLWRPGSKSGGLLVFALGHKWNEFSGLGLIHKALLFPAQNPELVCYHWQSRHSKSLRLNSMGWCRTILMSSSRDAWEKLAQDLTISKCTKLPEKQNKNCHCFSPVLGYYISGWGVCI